MKPTLTTLLAALALLWVWQPATAQQRTLSYDTALYEDLEYRSIGPFRGGRSAAITGVPGQALTHYFGAAGGGVWKTQDGGQNWKNVSDGFFGGSIGAVAVSEWDPNVIYVGGGEKTLRGNWSSGYGMWKSFDAGKTWENIGLNDSRHIPRVRIHPRNPDLVYAAVLGHAAGPNDERGVYRSSDGGETWENILFVSDEAGAVDLAMDPSNPRVLYATFWKVKRTPYSLESGGEGSSLWKTTDGGDTWTEITRNNGLPQGMIGISGITVSPANPDRLWAIIEAEDGGLFRSEDAGMTWQRVSDDRNLRQRAWYYTRLYADPVREDRVYVLNVGFHRSDDGGRTFTRIGTPHGDHHDLWIDPANNQHLAIADDGGGQVSYDGGENWSTYMNQPTSQFYRVTTDDAFPYRIYGAQQDNSTVRIAHRSGGGAITEDDWEPTAGGESGWIAPDPKHDYEVVYGGSYGGLLTRVDHRTGETRAVNVWPDNPMGHGAEHLKYRFQWNFPILFSKHDPNKLLTAANVLFVTENEGQTWEAISGDLTRDDPSTMGPSGGPITKDNTAVEYYGTIFAVAEGNQAGTIWTGSDDGLIYVTQDWGDDWKNVTPPTRLLPEWAQINAIEADPFNDGGLYVAATRYKSDDFTPYLLKTEDWGRTWRRIDSGIPRDHFTRVVRADPAREGLLYAGTEAGMYVSFDDGASWKPFQMNLPIVPITDLTIKNDDLIVATQGRSFWVIDDLTPLHQLSDEIAAGEAYFFTPRPTYRMAGGGGWGTPSNAGANPPSGAVFRYYLAEDPEAEVKLTIMEEDGDVIKTFSSKAKDRDEKISPEAGMNTFAWNMRYPDAEDFDGLIMWAGSLRGPQAVPGTYMARLEMGDTVMEREFEILPDPRVSPSVADMQAQFDFVQGINAKLTETHRAIKRIREVRKQIDDVAARIAGLDGSEAAIEKGKAIKDELTRIENELYQTKNRSGQDPLNFPIKLNNKLAAVSGLMGRGDYRPTDSAYQVRDELTAAIDAELAQFRQVMRTDVTAFNTMVKAIDLPAITVEVATETTSDGGGN